MIRFSPPTLLFLRRTVLSLCVACALGPSWMEAQAADGSKLPSFDIVSVKENKSGSGSMRISTHDSHFTATNVTLKTLLLNGYGLKEAQLVGLPDWGDTAHFDVEAKMLDPDTNVLNNLTEEQRGSMLQGMLADRFGLKAHFATAVLPVYELTVAKAGSKLKPSDGKDNHTSVRNTELTATGITLASLCYTLSSDLGRMVVDKTGLTGKYDLTLKWSKEDAPSADNTQPPLFTAIQEQLGLKLVPAKAPIQTLIIDTVAMPSEN